MSLAVILGIGGAGWLAIALVVWSCLRVAAREDEAYARWIEMRDARRSKVSTDVIRRCDGCRRDVPADRPLYVVEATISAVGGRVVRLPGPRDACSEPCVIGLTRNLFREATVAPACVSGA